MAGGSADEENNLEYTPTWAVAVVCSVFVIISLLLERGIHRLGKILRKKNQKPLYEALEKLKEELMLLGFISLLLTVFQGPIHRICIPERYTNNMLPCKRPKTEDHTAEEHSSKENTSRKLLSLIGSTSRRLLASGGSENYCKKGKKPFLSAEGMHQLHIFIFVLAIVHVVFCVLTMLLGSAKIRTWKIWEKDIREKRYNAKDAMKKKITHVANDDFVKTHAMGMLRESYILSWMASFFKQFFGSVTKADYSTLRLSFIETHCKSNPQFDFHKYMMRTLEEDFKKVVGISGYLWAFVVLFLLINVNGWHTYFWIAFLPLILLLAVGAKLEHVITRLAQEVAEKHTAVEGAILVRPSDDHFWFHRPKLVLYLIHFILFQNAFEIAFFFWILTTYGFDSCIMDSVGYIVPRLVIGVIVQVLCSYSTLPLYALVTQMGTTFKRAIFEEHIHEGLSAWHQKVQRRVKGKVKQTTKTDSDSDRGNIQMLKTNGNGTSRMQSRADHNTQTTEIVESRIEIPNSLEKRENQ